MLLMRDSYFKNKFGTVSTFSIQSANCRAKNQPTVASKISQLSRQFFRII